MKFVRQRNEFSCGPIALLNAGKAMGKNWTYKSQFKKLSKMCKCSKRGSPPEAFFKAVYTTFKDCEVEFQIWPKIKDIQKFLKQGYVLLANEIWCADKGPEHHVFVMTKTDSDKICGINFLQKGTVSLSPKVIHKVHIKGTPLKLKGFKRQCVAYLPYMWAIKPKVKS